MKDTYVTHRHTLQKRRELGELSAVFIILNLRLGRWVGLRDFGLVIINFPSQVVGLDLRKIYVCCDMDFHL